MFLRISKGYFLHTKTWRPSPSRPVWTRGVSHTDILTGGFFRLFLQARLYSLHLLLGDVEDRDDDGGGVLTATELR